MQASNIVILQGDAGIAQSLINSLCSSFHAVHAVRSFCELRTSITKHRPRVIVLDIETASLAEIRQLSREFPGVSIVCTHRLADEEMWMEALSAGAVDVCPSTDARAVLSAALRNQTLAHGFAA